MGDKDRVTRKSEIEIDAISRGTGESPFTPFPYWNALDKLQTGPGLYGFLLPSSNGFESCYQLNIEIANVKLFDTIVLWIF